MLVESVQAKAREMDMPYARYIQMVLEDRVRLAN